MGAELYKYALVRGILMRDALTDKRGKRGTETGVEGNWEAREGSSRYIPF